MASQLNLRYPGACHTGMMLIHSESVMVFPLRYLHDIDSDRIYLTQHTEAWLQRRHLICFGIPFEQRAQWYVSDISYLQSLVKMMRDTA